MACLNYCCTNPRNRRKPYIPRSRGNQQRNQSLYRRTANQPPVVRQPPIAHCSLPPLPRQSRGWAGFCKGLLAAPIRVSAEIWLPPRTVRSESDSQRDTQDNRIQRMAAVKQLARSRRALAATTKQLVEKLKETGSSRRDRSHAGDNKLAHGERTSIALTPYTAAPAAAASTPFWKLPAICEPEVGKGLYEGRNGFEPPPPLPLPPPPLPPPPPPPPEPLLLVWPVPDGERIS